MKSQKIALTALLAGLLIWAAFQLWPDAVPRPVTAGPGDPETPERVDTELAPLAAPEVETRREAQHADPTEADLEPTEPHESALEDGITLLRGTLLDAGTKLPLVGHRVELMRVFERAHEELVAVTDAEGVFVIEVVPGEHLILHRAEPGAGERSLPRVVTPHRFEVVHTPGGAPHEATFHARRPPSDFEVEVTHADGRPAAGALVHFSCRMDDEPFVDPANRTDDEGRVRLGVWNTVEFTYGRLTASDDDGNVSDVVPVDAPFIPGLRRLVLAPGAVLAVRVLDHDGAPVEGRRVLLTGDATVGTRLYRDTGPDGRHRFDGLFTGNYEVRVRLTASGGWHRGPPVELVRGESRSLDIELEEPTVPLAVAGTVLDEGGEPLANATLAITLDGLGAGTVRSGADGRFRFHAQRADLVRVGANVVQQGDRFEPAEVEVAFGTEFVVFRRTAAAVERTFEVEVYDRVTGEEVEHFVATIDRGPGTEPWSDSYAPRRRFVLRVLDDARWRVKSHGYVTRELNLAEALDALEEGERLRVGLDPGLDHSFLVLDADTSEPIPGVLFRSETGGETRSNGAGRVRIRSDHWSVYRVTQDGYEPTDWDPDDEALWGTGPFWLIRSR